MNKLEKANKYIKENISSVKNRPSYHLTPEIGWINDPNGFCYYKGKYHLFYQFYPYDVRWNDMHWGHATSKDLINWCYEDVAMANDTLADANGCFSGSAIVKDEKLYLMYTGHLDPNLGFPPNFNEVLQQQCIATSDDGINFTKYENNPVISQFDLPEGYRKSDFRDPKIVEKDGVYYVVIAVKNLAERGEVLLYKSLDLYKWDFVSSIYKSKHEENMMIECPDLFSIDGKEVIIFSGMPCNPIYDKSVGNTTEYLIGNLNFQTGEYTLEARDILDYGNSFYAPQSMENPENERIVIGWMKKWLSSSIVVPKDYGWSGMMSLPRKLSVDSNRLIQNPVLSIENYMVSKEEIKLSELNEEFIFHKDSNNVFNFRCAINTDSNNSIIYKLFGNNDKSIRIVIDLLENTVTYISDFDNIKEVYNVSTKLLDNEQIVLDLYLDKYSIELFVNKGKSVFSFTSFNEGKGNSFSLSSEKSAKFIYAEINQINVE